MFGTFLAGHTPFKVYSACFRVAHPFSPEEDFPTEETPAASASRTTPTPALAAAAVVLRWLLVQEQSTITKTTGVDVPTKNRLCAKTRLRHDGMNYRSMCVERDECRTGRYTSTRIYTCGAGGIVICRKHVQTIKNLLKNLLPALSLRKIVAKILWSRPWSALVLLTQSAACISSWKLGASSMFYTRTGYSVHAVFRF